MIMINKKFVFINFCLYSFVGIIFIYKSYIFDLIRDISLFSHAKHLSLVLKIDLDFWSLICLYFVFRLHYLQHLHTELVYVVKAY